MRDLDLERCHDRTRSRLSFFFATLLSAGLAACGDSTPEASATDSTSTSGSTSTGTETNAITETTGTTETSTTGAPGDWRPAACDDLESPFLDAECLVALQDSCQALSSDACVAREPLDFGDGQYQIRCGWAKVVRFADVETCAVAEVLGRCEAGIEQLIPCSDACIGEPDLYHSLAAVVASAELIKMPCSPTNSVLDGPLGAHSAVGAEPGAVGTCADDIVPPPPPLCACRDVACQSE
ncbi:MAG: hypothetical protein R3B09_34410 [Nannocystaceae bacterium]